MVCSTDFEADPREVTAAEQAQIDAAWDVYDSKFAGGPIPYAAAIAAYDQLVQTLAPLRPYQQQVLIEGGGGNDEIRGPSTGNVTIRGGDGIDKLWAGGFATTIYGGADTDLLVGGGLESHLYGGDGGAPDSTGDIFEVGPGTFVEGANSEDFVVWAGGFQVTGGVQLSWQESGYANWQGGWGALSGAGWTAIAGGGYLTMAVSFMDAMNIGTMIRYGMTSGGQLLMEFARGRGGQAVIQNYQLNFDTGQATGNVVAFRQYFPEVNSIEGLTKYLNLALKAGYGRCTIGTDPLILDLDGDGIELTGSASAYFDFNADGFREKAVWVKGDDGFLVRDLNGNGVIDNITEMFGNALTPGFTALKALDTNGDNKISALDAGWSTLRVWRDLDGDGVTDAGELKTLAELGIGAICAARCAESRIQ
jgi:hypothetical protein